MIRKTLLILTAGVSLAMASSNVALADLGDTDQLSAQKYTSKPHYTEFSVEGRDGLMHAGDAKRIYGF